MATTITQGAFFGSGVYGVNRYGVASVIYIPDGLEAVSAVGILTVEAEATADVVGVEAVSFVGAVSITADADVPVNGVVVSSFAGSVVVLENEVVSVSGFSLVSANGVVSVLTTSVNYEAIRENYERERTVYVDGRLQRFVYVDGVPRIVYVDSPISQYERAAQVAGDYRQAYVNRGTTQQERIVVVEE